MLRFRLTCCLVLWIGAANAVPTFAQPTTAPPTNEAVLARLAVECLGDVPTADAIWLEAPERLPYVRPALTRHWADAGRSVFLPDDTTTPAANDGRLRLGYAVDEAAVAYARDGRRYARTVTLALRYTLRAPDGRVLDEAPCRRTFTDALRPADLPAVNSATYAEAQGTLPDAGPLRRWLEPALLAGTLGVLAYLFFAVRSDG